MADKSARDALDGAAAEVARELQRTLYLARVDRLTLARLDRELDRKVR